GYRLSNHALFTAMLKRIHNLRNRMREIRSYGSVGERGGNEPLYPEIGRACNNEYARCSFPRWVNPSSPFSNSSLPKTQKMWISWEVVSYPM
ncbi:MAG TPA: hypothetical protein VKA08_09445, partial [Balneolales bacterium]|nr:hypothetical protein [Balneolales bacterium]